MQIIKNEQQLQEFIDILPDLQHNEKFYLHLQVRKKYTKKIKNADKVRPALQRFTAHKDEIIDKLRQLEVPNGVYRTRSGEIVPEEGMVMYIMPNPRCMVAASYKTIKELTDNLFLYSQDNKRRVNPCNIALHAIHTSKSRSCFVHFDVDDVSDYNDLFILEKIVGNKDAVHIIKTKGGAHVLIKPELVTTKNNWYQEIVKTFEVDQSGDIMTPIPGCIQGDFVPQLWKKDG